MRFSRGKEKYMCLIIRKKSYKADYDNKGDFRSKSMQNEENKFTKKIPRGCLAPSHPL